MRSAVRGELVRQVMPGLWEDAEGNERIVIEELLEAGGQADTPENRERARFVMLRLLKDRLPEILQELEIPITPENLAQAREIMGRALKEVS